LELEEEMEKRKKKKAFMCSALSWEQILVV